MSRRDSPALGSPPSDLHAFPRWTLAAARVLWRCHRADRGPWWFASTGDGRFDLPDPDGTCYLAGSAQTALREAFGGKLLRAGAVTPTFLAGRVVSRLHVAHAVRMADARSATAVSAGLSREIHTITPYDLPQQWARAWHAAGCGGIRYEPRHTTGVRDVSFAVFGPHGRGAWPVDPSPRTAAAEATASGIAVVAPSRRPGTVAPPTDVGS